MAKAVDLAKIYARSAGVVAREIEGEIIIVPLVGGIGDMEDELFTLNETGKAIWKKLDGNKKLVDLIRELEEEFEAPEGEIQQDVIGLIEELLKRNILIESA